MPATPSLDGPRAKLARAREHIKTLFDEMREFDKTQPFTTQHSRKTRDDIWRLVVRTAPLTRLGLIAGDVAHNLRSSLDQLVWQLALSTTPHPSRQTQFPICDTKQHFDRTGKKQIEDLPQPARTLIASVQPCEKNEAGHILALLREINNADKHRISIGALPRQTGLIVPLWCVDYLDAVTGIRNDGDVVLRLRREPGRAELDEHDLKQIRVTFDLGFNVPRVYRRKGSIIANFNEIHRAIDEQLLTKCERFFH